MKRQRKLSKKEQDLKDEWDKMMKSHSAPKFAGKYGNTEVKKRVFNIQKLSPAGGARQVNNDQVKIRSVPMGAGGTVPYDASLEEAKAGLAWRAGQIYNKGGNMFMTDDDLAQMKTGALRRRN